MNNFIIGLLDDRQIDRTSIRSSIKENWPTKDSVPSFIEYEINTEEAIIEQITKDIVNEEINCLIVDYKLYSETELIEGDNIVCRLASVFQKFPFVILTVVSHDVYSNNKVDPDKVYEKKLFTKIESDDAKLYISKLYAKMVQYKTELTIIEKEKREIANELIHNQEDRPGKQEKEIELFSRMWELDFKQSLYNGLKTDNPESDLIINSLKELTNLFSKIDYELEKISDGEKV